MKIYYVAGLPYSDELYHYGTKGMRWGQRLYQYEDGTLTPLGKIHYGVKKAAGVVGRAAVSATKTIGKHQVNKFKDKHPWTLSDEELKKRTERIKLEVSYKQALRDRSKLNRGKELIRGILESGLQTLGSKMFNAIGEKMFGKKEPKIRDLEELLNDPKAKAKDFDVAKKAWDAKKEIQKEKALDKTYDLNNIKSINDMSKREMDDLNAWLGVNKRVTSSIKETDEYKTGREALDEWREKASTKH